VLGWSRHMVARLVFDQSTETWLRCHVEAFAELAGVPAVIVPDYVPRHIIGIMCPLAICGGQCCGPTGRRDGRCPARHITGRFPRTITSLRRAQRGGCHAGALLHPPGDRGPDP
jgi:hypothetical protein